MTLKEGGGAEKEEGKGWEETEQRSTGVENGRKALSSFTKRTEDGEPRKEWSG